MVAAIKFNLALRLAVYDAGPTWLASGESVSALMTAESHGAFDYVAPGPAQSNAAIG
jgi:hypothetical protein